MLKSSYSANFLDDLTDFRPRQSPGLLIFLSFDRRILLKMLLCYSGLN